MVNLLGAEGYTGKAVFRGFEAAQKIDGAKLHLYGKAITKPFRKMGHATVVDSSLEKAKAKARRLQEVLQIISV